MVGGQGDDTYYVNFAGDLAVEASGQGHDTVFSTISIVLNDHSQNIEDLTLIGSGNIDGSGTWLANVITGNAGNNVLDGRYGDDALFGGAGDDVLIGGLGADTLAGGLGDDVFLFITPPGAANADLVVDFTQGSDLIGLSAAAFAAMGAGTPAPGSVVNAAAALDSGDRLIFDASGGKLFFDQDGSGAAEAQLIAILQGVTSLSESDFLIY
jgi:Ca2+-binding RTX toxin-like protein